MDKLRRKRYAKNYPVLWFDSNLEEAMNFYISIFKNSKAGDITRYGELGLGPKGSVMTATFLLDQQEFMALNGGPYFVKSQRVMKEMLQMDKLDIERLKRAYGQK